MLLLLLWVLVSHWHRHSMPSMTTRWTIHRSRGIPNINVMLLGRMGRHMLRLLRLLLLVRLRELLHAHSWRVEAWWGCPSSRSNNLSCLLLSLLRLLWNGNPWRRHWSLWRPNLWLLLLLLLLSRGWCSPWHLSHSRSMLRMLGHWLLLLAIININVRMLGNSLRSLNSHRWRRLFPS